MAALERRLHYTSDHIDRFHCPCITTHEQCTYIIIYIVYTCRICMYDIAYCMVRSIFMHVDVCYCNWQCIYIHV